MKKKKSVIIVILSVIVILVAAVSLFFILNDKNKLTVVERKWINNNISNIQNINVINNLNVMGKNGSGVFYDFIEDFKNEYDLSINPITYNSGTNPSGITLGVKSEVSKDDIVFATDHYVLVGINDDIISKEESLNGKTIGILTKDLSYT